MSVYAGPEISNDGLVFAYDMTNTQKSWRGAPTTNLLTDSENFGNWAVGGTIPLEYGSTTNPYGALTATKITNSVASNIRKAYAITISTVVCFSIHVRKFSSSTISVESNTAATGSMTFNFDTGGITSSGAYTSPVVTSLENGWYRISSVITASSTGDLNIYLYGNSYGTAGSSYIWGAQLDPGTFPTPYLPTTNVIASRSNTQAILDLTNNNTVTATSLTYASDNTFSFNGSSNYVDCGNSLVLQQSTAITMAAWVKPTSSTGLGNIMSKNANSGYRFRIDNGSLWWYVSGNASIGGSCPNNVWSYCAVTGDSSGLKVYVNGIQVASNTTAFAPSAPAIGNLYIGCYSPTLEPFNGTIATAHLYNKALSAAEIKQNFNALRGRFGI